MTDPDPIVTSLDARYVRREEVNDLIDKALAELLGYLDERETTDEPMEAAA